MKIDIPVPELDEMAYNFSSPSEANKVLDRFLDQRREFISYCRDRKFKYKEIAQTMGLSVERVYEIYRYRKSFHGPTVTLTKSKAKKRDGMKCVLCKSKNTLLHSHHIGDSTNHAISNLITLCPKCHRNVHKYEKIIKNIQNETIKVSDQKKRGSS